MTNVCISDQHFSCHTFGNSPSQEICIYFHKYRPVVFILDRLYGAETCPVIFIVLHDSLASRDGSYVRPLSECNQCPVYMNSICTAENFV